MRASEAAGTLHQLAWYAHGYSLCAAKHYGELQGAYCIAISTADDLDISVYRINPQTLISVYNQIADTLAGEPRTWMGCAQIAREYRLCVKTKDFPGIGDDGVREWERPEWAIPSKKLTMGGTPIN